MKKTFVIIAAVVGGLAACLAITTYIQKKKEA